MQVSWVWNSAAIKNMGEMDPVLALQVSSIFIILVFSSIGAFLPMFVATFGQKDVIHGAAFRFLRCMGTGIILGVGFIHVLVDATGKLSEVSFFALC